MQLHPAHSILPDRPRCHVTDTDTRSCASRASNGCVSKYGATVAIAENWRIFQRASELARTFNTAVVL